MITRSQHPNSSLGQATIEYLFVLIFVVLIATRVTKDFNSFMGRQMGSLGGVLSKHLSVGICKNECLFYGYKNGGQ